MAFTQDWFSNNIPVWERLFAQMKGRPNLQVLEIGSFEGRSACWLLEHVLTGDGAGIDCVDTFMGSMEFTNLPVEPTQLLARFKENTGPWGARVTTHVGRSDEVLPALQKTFDVIYVDGSHLAQDTLTDAVLAWRLLKVGGLMIFDDYEWNFYSEAELNPKPGINAFLHGFNGWFELVFIGYQVVIRKCGSYDAGHKNSVPDRR